MKNHRFSALAVFAVLILACFEVSVLGQGSSGNLANVSGGGSIVRWEVLVSNSGVGLTISAPDGRSFSKDFKAGTSPEVNITDRRFDGLPDGAYSYELRLRPVLSSGARDALMKARGKDDDPEAERAGRKRPAMPSLVQSGSFAILNGAIVLPGGTEGQRSSAKSALPTRVPEVTYVNAVGRFRNHRIFAGARPDDVVPDDQIVQGSECVGLDCVNGEVFGFDTIRMKENNTRLQFDDTSTSQGFPTNNWQIRANDSASGGSSFLGFVDQGSTGNSETGTIVGRFDAGAPANSFKVSSTGKIGLRTATPVLDIHMNTSDTPAIRLEQNNSGGFAAQTWDVAGNEANFFVRDVTSGSRLPFRIRPGAPTSSIDISDTGAVGVGTASPTAVETFSKLTVEGSDATSHLLAIINDGAGQTGLALRRTGASAQRWFQYIPAGSTDLRFFSAADVVTIQSGGNVGIGTTAPTQLLSVNGTAGKPGGGTWDVFSDERLKNIKGRFNTGLKAVMQLQPIRYEYKPNNPLGIKSAGENIGFGAQSLQKIIPEAVTLDSAGYLMVKSDPILWTMLNAIKEQQAEIAQLKAQVRKLQRRQRK